MTTFLDMYSRIARELTRSGITPIVKDGINDAIKEASQERFYFNIVTALPLVTVAGQEYYGVADNVNIANLEQIDCLYYIQGGVRLNLADIGDGTMNRLAVGNIQGGQPMAYSRHGMSIRLYPVPSVVLPMYIDGYFRLTPWPLVNDTDTNAWLTEGELYIRALAKRNILRDAIRDLKEASAVQAVAAGYREELLEATDRRLGGTDTFVSRSF